MQPSTTCRVLLLVALGAAAAGAQRPSTPRAPTPTVAPTPAPARAPRAIRLGESDDLLVTTPRPGVYVVEPNDFDLVTPAIAPVAPMEPLWGDVAIVTTPRPALAPMPPMDVIPARPLWTTEPMTPMPPMVWDVDVTPRATTLRSRDVGGIRNTLPRAIEQVKSPEDSLWKVAREALNRTEYRVAARYFRELREKYPRSSYAPDAAYYEAFSLYRIGTVEDLRNALTVLRGAQAQNVSYSRDGMQADAVTLAARIQGALARGGDAAARDWVDSQTKQAGGARCDEEDLSVRVEALSALTQMDEASAVPVLKRVLARRDACTASLRKRAVYLLVRSNADSSAPPVLLDVVANDPDTDVRVTAIDALGRLSGRRATDALQTVLNTSKDENVQKAAVRALAGRDDWTSLRSFVERTDAPVALRTSAISGISRERASADDVAWLRALYTRTTEQEIRETIVNTVARLGGDANEQWLIALARNPNEPYRARSTAIARLARSQAVTAADFVKIYDAASERPVREYVLRVLGERGEKEPAAVDKLIVVARSSTDPVLGRTAVSILSRYKSNPQVQKVLLELIDR